MDTIFYHGNIYTQDPACPKCSALAIKNGIIIALGNDEDILSMATGRTKLINLNGHLMMPGFVDTHMHVMFYAQLAGMIDLSRARSFEDVRRLFADKITENSADKDKWVQGIGFNQDTWDIKQVPTRRDLDLISTEIPITIRRACYHITVCNTKAMEIMGLMKEQQESTTVNMGFYPDGTPNGLLNEDSQNLVSNALPLPSLEDLQQMILSACQDAAAQGITEIHTDDFTVIPGDWGRTIMAAYTTLSKDNKLPVRIYQQCSLWDMDSLKNFLSAGYCTGDDFGFYRIGPLKLIADGSLGAHTAWMRKPYKNAPDTCGSPNMSDDEMYSLMKYAHDRGMQIATHCIGDASLEQALNTYERIQLENPRSDCRHGIVHCQIMDSAQQDRFQKQNILAYVQPIFLRSDMHIVDDCIGAENSSQTYNWRRYVDLGVHMSGGSDCPVEPFDILPNLAYAVTRTNPDTGESWHTENGLTLEEAVKMFTAEGAYTSFAEKIRGSLSVGKCADMVVLDKDIFNIPSSEIHTAKVLLTMVGGKISHDNMQMGK